GARRDRAVPLDPAGYRSLGVPVALVAGELSRHRPPYGGALERVRATLGVDDVTLLPGQDHLAHVTGPDLLARTLAREIARVGVEPGTWAVLAGGKTTRARSV